MNKDTLVHLFHIIIVGFLFLYVGIQQNLIPKWLYSVLFYLGIFMILYHGYKSYIKFSSGKNPWINLFHILIVAPLLIYIGYNAAKTPYYAYQLLLMLAFTVIGYHAYYLFIDV